MHVLIILVLIFTFLAMPFDPANLRNTEYIYDDSEFVPVEPLEGKFILPPWLRFETRGNNPVMALRGIREQRPRKNVNIVHAQKMHYHLHKVLDNCILFQDVPGFEGFLHGCQESDRFRTIVMSLWDCWKSYPNWMLNNTLQLKKRGRPSKHDSATTLKNARNMMGSSLAMTRCEAICRHIWMTLATRRGETSVPCTVFIYPGNAFD